MTRLQVTIDPPANASAVFVLVSLFMLREIEVAIAQYHDMTFNDEELEVRLNLPVSKNDPEAKGASRPWRCICAGAPTRRAHRRCPYHAATNHREYLLRIYGDAMRDDDDFPLFPDRGGQELDPDRALEFIE